MSRRIHLLAFGFVFAVASGAQAQSDEAERYFQIGSTDLEAGRAEQAIAAFRRSLELYSQRPATALNLSVAYARIGDYVAAEQHLLQLLEGVYGDLSDNGRESVQTRLTEVESHIGVLAISVPADADATVRVDGETVSLRRGSASVRVNPGTHEVSAQAAGRAPIARTVSVGEGRLAEVSLSFTDTTDAVAAAVSPAPDPLLLGAAGGIEGSESSDATESPPNRRGLWIGLSVGLAAAIGVGIALPFILSSPAGPDAPFANIQALSSRNPL